MKKVVIKKYYDWHFQVVEVKEGQKMFEHQRLSTVFYADYTPELDEIIKQHNDYLDMSKKYSELAYEKQRELMEFHRNR